MNKEKTFLELKTVCRYLGPDDARCEHFARAGENPLCLNRVCPVWRKVVPFVALKTICRWTLLGGCTHARGKKKCLSDTCPLW